MMRRQPQPFANRFRTTPARLILGLIILIGSVVPTFSQLPPLDEDQGVNGFGLSLRKLGSVGSVLVITAHPDDENNALLALLSRGKGYRVGLLTLTRGDGGQNEIGPELFEALGVLRSEELAAVHRYDGVQQFFSRAFEFGYSFSVEETFEKWGREEILRDIVRVIRMFRPDVIITMNPTGTGGGQHHQASAQLASEAFMIADDSSRFPEQLAEGLRPWRPLRLFQSAGPGMGSGGSGRDVDIPLDEYDPLLGETYAQFGARARGNHRSQGMMALPEPGPMSAGLALANSTVESSHLQHSVFDQIDTGLERLSVYDPHVESSVTLLEGYINWAQEAYTRSDYTSALRAVMAGIESLGKMKDETSNPEAAFLIAREMEDFQNAAEKGTFSYSDALLTSSKDGILVRDESAKVRLRYYSHADAPVEVTGVELVTPGGWLSSLDRSADHSWTFSIKVGPKAAYSQPYWFRDNPNIDRFSVRTGFTGIEPYAPPPVTAIVHYRVFGIDATLKKPVQYRWYAAEYGGERRHSIIVAPKLSVHLTPSISIVRLDQATPREFEVSIKNMSPGPMSAEVRLQGAGGWSVSPAVTTVSFSNEDDVQNCKFTLTPPRRLVAGKEAVKAVASAEGVDYNSGIEEIAYSHIQPRIMLPPADTLVEAINVTIPANLKVGYVMGVGDDVGTATEQLGASVTYLTADDLASGDLSQYDVIVTGVRAYLAREDLVANNQRLLEYVREGGHLVVQYNKYEFLRKQFAPYPLTINRPHDRVTVEESPVKILVPDHPLLNYPNRITEADWQGWVQERGLYFLGSWDEKYIPLLELRDPWPYNNEPKRGALVVAQYGKGTYIYTGLAFFRQLPAGVPGAYRLWANLISLGH